MVYSRYLIASRTENGILNIADRIRDRQALSNFMFYNKRNISNLPTHISSDIILCSEKYLNEIRKYGYQHILELSSIDIIENNKFFVDLENLLAFYFSNNSLFNGPNKTDPFKMRLKEQIKKRFPSVSISVLLSSNHNNEEET